MPVFTNTEITCSFEYEDVTYFVKAVPWQKNTFKLIYVIHWDGITQKFCKNINKELTLEAIVKEWNIRRDFKIKLEEAKLEL
jgi:hypothetical protein